MKLAEALSIRKDLQKRIQQFSLTATPLRRYGRNVSLMSSSSASRLMTTLDVCASLTWRFWV